MNKIFLQSSVMDISEVTQEHPNKQYWRGIIATVDQPSQRPPQGAGGLRVQLSKEDVIKNLDTIKGMPVNVHNFTGHDQTAVIGIVANAWLEENDLWAEGYLYNQNFPDECQTIRTQKDDLGFSFEIISSQNPIDNICYIDNVCFVGLAILNKDSAAYGDDTQMIAASKKVDDNVDKDELQNLLNDMVTKFEEKVNTIKASFDTVSDSIKTEITASNEKIEQIKASIETGIVKAQADETPPSPQTVQTVVANADLTTPTVKTKAERMAAIHASTEISMLDKIKEITKINKEAK